MLSASGAISVWFHMSCTETLQAEKKLSFPKSIILISDLLREVAVVGCCVISRGDIPSHEDGQPD